MPALPRRLAERNVGTALEAGGATWDDVAKMTILVVGCDSTMADVLFTGVSEVFGDAMPDVATTLLTRPPPEGEARQRRCDN